MPDRWMIRGAEYSNCNCDYGCPCQFNSPTTHGHCEALATGHIDEGFFNDTRLDGLHWAMIVYWPGEIAEGNGRQQAIIDERATPEQREALAKILYGEATTPGATHFYVFNSTMSEVFDPIYASIELEIDWEARRAELSIPNLVRSKGSPIMNPNTGQEHQARIHLPQGFEYTIAEIGSGETRADGSIRLRLSDSHAHFNVLHMNQDGVVR